MLRGIGRPPHVCGMDSDGGGKMTPGAEASWFRRAAEALPGNCTVARRSSPERLIFGVVGAGCFGPLGLGDFAAESAGLALL
mmetsp:Transcript_49794/g.143290  ORF Transcript_49794/g.143290 Transcript_49794/m.143290 type:complete len:82 (+) Transcript_49794:2366-2611(+)